jgi:hypothetical protein
LEVPLATGVALPSIPAAEAVKVAVPQPVPVKYHTKEALLPAVTVWLAGLGPLARVTATPPLTTPMVG